MRPLLALAALASALPIAAQTYRIAGVVVNSETGAALDRVKVSVSPTSARTRPMEATTGSNGRFAFANLPADKWLLTARRRGYLDQEFGQPASLASASVAIVTGPGEDTDHLVFGIHKPAMIAGKVVDSSGDPVENAFVQVLRWAVVNGRRQVHPFSSGWTNDDGAYAIGFLPAGSYFVAATGEPWYGPRLNQDRGAVAFPPQFYPNTPDPRAAVPVALRPGQEATADFTLTPAPAFTLTLNARRAQSARLRLSSEGIHGSPIWQSNSQEFSAPAYSFRLVPGRYTVWTWGGDFPVAATQTIELGSSNTEIDLAQDEPANVEVLVARAGMKPAEVADLGLGLVSEDGSGASPRMIPQDGALKFPSMPPGRYRLALIGPGAEDAYIDSVSAEGARFAKDVLDLVPGSAVRLRVAVNGNGGRVEGKVYRAGHPFPGALVVLSGDPSDQHGFVTDSDGSFDFKCVKPGNYVIYAVEDGSELEYSNPANLKSGQPVLVEPRKSLNLRLDLPEPAKPREAGKPEGRASLEGGLRVRAGLQTRGTAGLKPRAG